MSPAHHRSATVVGAGVSGLTTAVLLAETGFRVRVHTDLPPNRTMSARAGASWGPYQSGHESMDRWSAETLTVLNELATVDGNGVRLVAGTEAYRDLPEIPSWARGVPGFRQCEPHEIPDGYDGAWRYTIPMIEMPRYLAYLEDRLRRAGAQTHVGARLDSLRDIDSDGLLINCAGLGAGRLVGDDAVQPSRGQLTVVRNPGVDEFFQDNVDSPAITCVFPHGDHVVLGGISQPGSTALQFDPVQEQAMLERCARIEPKLKNPDIIERRIGLRPQRPRIRVERDPDTPRILHNYGHGGAGVTLSWGSAAEVLRLARET